VDTAESQAYDSYQGGMNPGPAYSGNANVKPADQSQGVPAMGARVRHRRSGESGTVTGFHVHGHSGEVLPQVRWAGQPSTGFTSDQGYSLDSLTNP
jgi:hypothetical protein